MNGSDDSWLKQLFGSVLQGYLEDWINGKLYLSELLERIRENLKKPIPFEAIHRDKVAFDEKNLTRIDKMKRM